MKISVKTNNTTYHLDLDNERVIEEVILLAGNPEKLKEKIKEITGIKNNIKNIVLNDLYIYRY